MTYEERSRVRRFSRVCKFGAAYRHLFPETSAAAVSFATIKAELPQLEALDLAERLASHNARTARAVAARKRLLDCLARASRTAEALARTIPQLAPLAERPGKMADHMLLSIARQFLEAISAHAGVFATHGIAVPTIEEPLELFALAVNERGVRRGEKVEARASINPSMARALEALAVLDVTVPNHSRTIPPRWRCGNASGRSNGTGGRRTPPVNRRRGSRQRACPRRRSPPRRRRRRNHGQPLMAIRR